MTEIQEIFTDVSAEGPFGFKPDRDSTINPHFNRFADLDEEQKDKLLRVRDGESQQCIIEFADEILLIEYSPAGYFDPTKQRQWGYTVRRVRTAPPVEAPPREPPAVKANSQSGVFPALSPKPQTEPSPRPASGLFQTNPPPTNGLSTPTQPSPPARDPGHEAELRQIRMEKDKALARSQQFEDEAKLAKSKLAGIEQSQTDAQRDKARLQAELTKLEADKQKLTLELRKANKDLNAQAALAASAAAAPAQRSLSEVASDEIRKQQRDLERQRRLLADEEERLTQLEIKLEQREAKLSRAESTDPQKTKIVPKQGAAEGEIWVPATSRSTRRKTEPVNDDEDRRAFVRVCIFWFIALVLLGQCIPLAWKIGHLSAPPADSTPPAATASPASN